VQHSSLQHATTTCIDSSLHQQQPARTTLQPPASTVATMQR
jgi:hypothetical protein